MDTEIDMEKSMDDDVVKYLSKIGKLLSDTCPAASRFYMSNLEKRLSENPDLVKNKKKNLMYLYCHHCGSIWNSSNFKVYTRSCQRLNPHLKKLLKMERNEEWKLNCKQKKKLKSFYNSTSKIVYKCLICDKNTFFAGSKSNSRCKTNETAVTPILKLKMHKKDTNAGLFIPSPISNSFNEKSNLDQLEAPSDANPSVAESPLNLCNSINLSSNMKEHLSNSSKQESPLSSFQSSSKKQSSVKRKNTLLAQILNQEKPKKKKNSLSSFLVSL